MAIGKKSYKEIPIFISRSRMSTEANDTGSWRFVRPIYNEKTAPCSSSCPAGEDIAVIEMHVVHCRFQEAFETILTENPFPSVCGRVCFHPCETSCNRESFDGSLAIHGIERFLGDKALAEGWAFPDRQISSTGKKVAIIGSGPAGLSAGYFLVRLGYQCEIFEKNSEPGGVLRWGIPNYRLPEQILKNEIKRIEDTGVKIYCEYPVTEDIFEKMTAEYDAVITGAGYQRSLKMDIPGGEMMIDGLEFLSSIKKCEINKIEGRTVVIGGGNTAVDVARSLLRSGEDVTIVYRRRKQDMPAFHHEIEVAEKEGVTIMELASPVMMKKTEIGYVLTLQKMSVKSIGPDSRAIVEPVASKTVKLEVDGVYSAIGAEADDIWMQLSGKEDNRIFSHCRLIQKKVPVILCGDLTNRVKSVADAVASGKQSAMVIDTWFKSGADEIEKRLSACRVGDGDSLSMEMYTQGLRKNRNNSVVMFDNINIDYFQSSPSMIPVIGDVKKNIRSFEEYETTYSEDTALKEAGRCFNCGICNDCDNCRLFCPELAVSVDDIRQINLEYCKGCGICVVECPRNAMILVEEKA